MNAARVTVYNLRREEQRLLTRLAQHRESLTEAKREERNLRWVGWVRVACSSPVPLLFAGSTCCQIWANG